VMLSLLLTQPELRERMLAEVRGPVTREAVRKATEIVECEPTSHPTTAGLAAAAGVSVRALQVGFREVLDTTPQAYMLEVRLRRAHDELRGAQAEEGATVTRIARRWGFGNVGRFAEQYRQAYGEKPSETLRHS
jgi:transcriptional regulator GlxA family with amidase domain